MDGGGDGDEVDVIRHEAVAEDAQVAVGGVSGQQSEIGVPVPVSKENVAAEVSALSDVVRAVNGRHASNACHRRYSGSKGGNFSHHL